MRTVYLKILWMMAVILPLMVVSGCDKQKTTGPAKPITLTVALAKSVDSLYFGGTLLPIHDVPVVSPVAGNITSLGFTYGERITKGQELFVIDSKRLADAYYKAVNDYLQKKQTYVIGKVSFEGTQVLYKAGAISQSDYISEETRHDDAVLDYYQAQYTLEKVLKTAHIDPNTIENLTLSDTERVNEALERHFENVTINAPSSGVALFPPPNAQGDNSSGSSGSNQLTEGTDVKERQLLLSIGDLSGLSATINVSEIDIDKIHHGMAVLVTGSAFPGATLHGVVDVVSAQANQDSSGGGGLSMYTVTVKIPSVDPRVMKKIRVGMTAKFQINIESKPRIMLPIEAVSQVNGQSMVTLVDAQGHSKQIPVVTGETTPTQVTIKDGLKAGDKVMYTPNSASTGSSDDDSN